MHRWATEIKMNILILSQRCWAKKWVSETLPYLAHIATSALTIGFWWNLSSSCANITWLIPVRKVSLWKQFLRVQTSQLAFMQSKNNLSTLCGHKLAKELACPKVSSHSNLDTYQWQIIDKTTWLIREITLCLQVVPSVAGFSGSASKELKRMFPASTWLAEVRKSALLSQTEELQTNSTKYAKSVQIQDEQFQKLPLSCHLSQNQEYYPITLC